MITSITNGFIAEFKLIQADLFAEFYMADKAFRHIPTTLLQKTNSATTTTVSIQDTRLVNGFKYFVRFFTKSGGLSSGKAVVTVKGVVTDFIEFNPTAVQSFILQEDGVSKILQEDGVSGILQETC